MYKIINFRFAIFSLVVFSKVFSQSMQDMQKMRSEYEKLKNNNMNGFYVYPFLRL